MTIVPNLFQCIFIDFIISFFFWMFGHIVLSPLKQNDCDNIYQLVFSKMLVGCISIVVLYAIIRSVFRTTLIAAAILSVYYLICLRKNNKIDIIGCSKQLKRIRFNIYIPLIYFVFLAIPIMAYAGLLMDTNGNMVFPSNDYAYYAGVAGRLADTGVETTNLYSLPDYIPTRNFYHYFELWLAALIYMIWGVSTEYAFMLCAIPIIVAITVLGAMAYAFSKTMNKFVSSGLAIILLFIFPISISMKHFSVSYDMVNSLLLSKNAIVFTLLVAILLEFKSKDMVRVCFLLSMVSILYLPTMPAIICIWLSSFVVSLIKKEKWNKDIILVALIPVVVIPFFYLFFGKSIYDMPEETGMFFQLKSVYGDANSYVHYIKCFVKYTLNFGLSFLPWLLLLFNPKCKVLLKHHKKTIIVLFLAFFCTIAGTTILNFMENSGQLFSIFWQTLFLACIYALIVECFSHLCYKSFFSVLVALCGAFFAYKDVMNKTWKSDEQSRFYTAIENEITDNDFTFAYIKNDEEYKLYDAQYQLWSKNITYTIPFCEIRRFNCHYYPICLSIYEIPKPQTARDWLYFGSGIQCSPFMQFVLKNDLSDNIDEAKLKFLSSNRVRYLIISLDNEWLEKVSLPIDTIFRVDGTNDCMIKLNWEE